jgi:hypothetical protein
MSLALTTTHENGIFRGEESPMSLALTTTHENGIFRGAVYGVCSRGARLRGRA